MSLLREIQNEAIDDSKPTANILRKCLILASRIGSKELEYWVKSELEGYGDVGVENASLIPDYRKRNCPSKGNFTNGFHLVKNRNIPSAFFPKEFRTQLTEVVFYEPIGVLEANISQATLRDIDAYSNPWNSNLVALHADKILTGYSCLEAWRVVPVYFFREIVETVRNKLLILCLEIEKVNLDVSGVPSNITSQESIKMIVHNTFNGSVNNVAQNSSEFSQSVTISDNSQLFSDIKSQLNSLKIDSEIIEKCLVIVEEMRNNQDKPTFKDSYKKFMGLLADHIQVAQALLPFIPTLSALI